MLSTAIDRTTKDIWLPNFKDKHASPEKKAKHDTFSNISTDSDCINSKTFARIFSVIAYVCKYDPHLTYIKSNVLFFVIKLTVVTNWLLLLRFKNRIWRKKTIFGISCHRNRKSEVFAARASNFFSVKSQLTKIFIQKLFSNCINFNWKQNWIFEIVIHTYFKS